MKNLFSRALILCTLLFVSAAHADITPALWKVEKQGVTSYLFGTVHVGDEEMNTLPKKVAEAISNTKEVVVEVNMSKISPAEIQQRSLPFTLLKNGRTLEGELSAQNYQALKDYFASINIDIRMFSPMKPWAVTLTIAQIEYQKHGYDARYGIDKQVVDYANENNIPVGQLETIEEQMQMLSSLDEHANEAVAETLAHLDDAERYFTRLVNSWKKGYMDVLGEYYNDAFSDTAFGKQSEQVMVINRNTNWVAQLTPKMEKEPVFVAVGALHLPEQYGLLTLLEAQGFTITRI